MNRYPVHWCHGVGTHRHGGKPRRQPHTTGKLAHRQRSENLMVSPQANHRLATIGGKGGIRTHGGEFCSPQSLSRRPLSTSQAPSQRTDPRRRGRDSNPRGSSPCRFQDGRLQPLGHLSAHHALVYRPPLEREARGDSIAAVSEISPGSVRPLKWPLSTKSSGAKPSNAAQGHS